MLGHCILVEGKQVNRGKTQASVDGNGPLQPVTPALAMTGMGQVRSFDYIAADDCFRLIAVVETLVARAHL